MLAKARAPPLVQGDVLLRFSSLSLEIQRGQRVGGWGGGYGGVEPELRGAAGALAVDKSVGISEQPRADLG